MKGQISLEFLLLMSAFISFLLLFTPLISKTFFSGIYALDSVKAKNFSDSFIVSARELNSMSNDSKITLNAKPLLKWKISYKNKKLNVVVLLEKYNKQKTFVSEPLNTIPFSEINLNEKTVFVLTKTEKGILVKSNKNFN